MIAWCSLLALTAAVIVVVPAIVGFMVGGSETTAWVTAVTAAVVQVVWSLLVGESKDGRR